MVEKQNLRKESEPRSRVASGLTNNINKINKYNQHKSEKSKIPFCGERSIT